MTRSRPWSNQVRLIIIVHHVSTIYVLDAPYSQKNNQSFPWIWRRFLLKYFLKYGLRKGQSVKSKWICKAYFDKKINGSQKFHINGFWIPQNVTRKYQHLSIKRATKGTMRYYRRDNYVLLKFYIQTSCEMMVIIYNFR